MTNESFPYTDLISKDWLNPLAVLELKQAVRKRKDTAVLNGREYTLSYYDERGAVFVKVVNDFIPCGWFSYEELERYEFEADHDKHL